MKRRLTTQASPACRLVVALGLAILLPVLAIATTFPAWWQQRGALVMAGNQPAPADDFAAINQGQLKNLAVAASEELDARIPSGAGPQIHALIASWFQTNPAGQFILDQGHRIPKVTASTDDFAAVNLGQLKTVAQPFYDRLMQIGYCDAYPWASSTTPPDDFALANLGQVKNLFNFNLIGFDFSNLDSDGDGLPDQWEIAHGSDPFAAASADADTDGDGLSDLTELQLGTDPRKADTDDDGLSDAEELEAGTDPTKKDTDGDGVNDGLDGFAGGGDKAQEKKLAPARVRKRNYAIVTVNSVPLTPRYNWGDEMRDKRRVELVNHNGNAVVSEYNVGPDGPQPDYSLWPANQPEHLAITFPSQRWGTPVALTDHDFVAGTLGATTTSQHRTTSGFRWRPGMTTVEELPGDETEFGVNGAYSSLSDVVLGGVWNIYDVGSQHPYTTISRMYGAIWTNGQKSLFGDVEYESYSVDAFAPYTPVETPDGPVKYRLEPTLGSSLVIAGKARKFQPVHVTWTNGDQTLSGESFQPFDPWGSFIMIPSVKTSGGGTSVTPFAVLYSEGGNPVLSETLESISQDGRVFGQEEQPDGIAVVWTPGILGQGSPGYGRIELTGLAQSGYINSSLQVAGGSIEQTQNARTDNTYLWENYRRYPLKDRCPGLADFSQLTICGIDDNGVIVATGKRTSDPDHEIVLLLLPVEIAPDVLRVNSNFDEGRIDPATGYAIPDCDDVDIALEAQRAHLDGKYTQYQRITDDLHPGWFGVNPQLLPKDFWDGGTVTIRKVDKIDDATGHPESGQIRFYAKWGEDAFQYCAIIPYNLETLAPVNLVQGGINKKPGEGVYGTSSTIPQNAKFYMEGVRPGKITLEWRFQKNGIDARHEQTFLVATKQTKAQWKEEVRYQVRLQTKVATGTAVDLATYQSGNGFAPNVPNVRAIYYFYRQLFRQMPEKFMWAGMAKVAAAPIYAGMSDMTEWWLASETLPPWPPDGIPHRDVGVEWFIKALLLAGQKNIFEDMAWAHRAYYASGIWALNHVEEKEDRTLTDFQAWKSLDAAIADADLSAISEANGRLLQREQQVVVQPNYNSITDLWLRQPPRLANWLVGGVTVPVNASGLANAGEWLSANANKNPIPGGPAFRAVVPGGRLDTYNDRWAWTSNATNGMLQRWTGASSAGPNFDAATRMQRNNLPMRTAAGFSSPVYSFDPDYLPTE